MESTIKMGSKITIKDHEIIIHGWLEASLLGDLLLLFDERGYTNLVPGEENSSLRLIKPVEWKKFQEIVSHQARMTEIQHDSETVNQQDSETAE